MIITQHPSRVSTFTCRFVVVKGVGVRRTATEETVTGGVLGPARGAVTATTAGDRICSNDCTRDPDSCAVGEGWG